MNDGLFDSVIAHFEQHGLNYDRVEGELKLHVGFNTSAGPVHCLVDVEPEMGVVRFYAYVPVQVSAERRGEMASFIAMANYGIKVGNFELDMRDGELRYKTSICMRDFPMEPDLMEPLVGFALTTVSQYMPGIEAVAHKDTDAAQAIALVEGPGGDDMLDELDRMLGDEGAPGEADEEKASDEAFEGGSDDDGDDDDERGRGGGQRDAK